MSTPNVPHLANLARIKISDAEADALTQDVAAIVDYVGVIDTLVSDASLKKRVGDRYNVLRDDEVIPPKSDSPAELIAQAPQQQDGYVVVKKVLG